MWTNNFQEIQEKLNSLLENFFIEHKDITEVMLSEWTRIGYKKNSGNFIYDIKENWWDWQIYNDELDLYQKELIIKKCGSSEKVLKDINDSFSRQWHYNYSFSIWEWENEVYLRVCWSICSQLSDVRIRKIPASIMSIDSIWVPWVLKDMLRQPKGGWLIVVTAPPSSGKSTTIASSIQDLVMGDKTYNIMTLEDPIEYRYKQWNSIIKQREKVFDFDEYSSAIDACMRQSLDIVVVQEMTNQQTIRDVMYLIEKGVLVITTMHTPCTTTAFESILNSFPIDERQSVMMKLSSMFKLFISQRLVPKINGWQVAVFEILLNTPWVRWKLSEGRFRHLHQVMTKDGNLLMSDDLIKKVEIWEISLETARSYCPETRVGLLEEAIKG